MTPTAEERRQQHRLKAKRRAEREKIPYAKALRRVRLSEVLMYLSRHPGRHLSYVQIAEGSAVPVSAVREICRYLASKDHELIRGRDTG